MAWAEWGKNRKSNMNRIEDWLASSPNFCLSKKMGHPLNSFHESPCSPIKIAIGMRYAVCITIFGHLHFEISWSNTRPPFFRQVCTPHVRSQRLSCINVPDPRWYWRKVSLGKVGIALRRLILQNASVFAVLLGQCTGSMIHAFRAPLC